MKVPVAAKTRGHQLDSWKPTILSLFDTTLRRQVVSQSERPTRDVVRGVVLVVRKGVQKRAQWLHLLQQVCRDYTGLANDG